MLNIQRREGERPETTNTNPHEQLTQTPNLETHEYFKLKLFDFDKVQRRPSIISVPGSEALWLDEGQPCNCENGFMVGREFAHIHPAYDGSLHVALSEEDFKIVIDANWGEKHPLAGQGFIPATIALVYAPRNIEEMDEVMKIVNASLTNARKSQKAA